MDPQKTMNNQSNLEKEAEGTMFPDFKLYYKVMLNSMVLAHTQYIYIYIHTNGTELRAQE